MRAPEAAAVQLKDRAETLHVHRVSNAGPVRWSSSAVVGTTGTDDVLTEVIQLRSSNDWGV